MRIVFFGNTEFSNPTLKKCNSSYDIISVVTNHSKQMGRGRTPVHPVEVHTMMKLAWYLSIIQGNSRVNAEINSKEMEDVSMDFYERFGLL